MSKNLLLYGELNRDFAPFRQQETAVTAAGWSPWWLTAGENDPHWKNRPPVFGPWRLGDTTVQQISTPWATHTGGLFQQVPAFNGNRYLFRAEALAWSSEGERPGDLLEPSAVNVHIGCDPTGGLDPASPLIQWSKPAEPIGAWQLLELAIEAQASIITLYLKSAPELPKRQQAVFWRQAGLTAVGRLRRSATIVGSGDTHIMLKPDIITPAVAATVIVSAARAHQDTSLLIVGPGEQEMVLDAAESSQLQGRYLWRYQFTPAAVGLYDLRFVGDRGARLLAQQLLRISEGDSLAQAAAQAPSGQPRLDYRRVYILLPPTADEQWLAAAAKGGFDGRYTIGFSVDDAGIGDLSQRRVLAVNPHHWPETLTAAWFHQHYPGVRFTGVVANTPEDLELWLRNWVDD
jgi:hypothetical protein